MVTIRHERRSDIPAREALLEQAFGESRWAKAAERLREGRVPAEGSIGTALMQRALREARRQGCRAVLLVGDAPYYGRFGFSPEKTGALWLPGPYERDRLLGCELTAGALDNARGLIAASRRGRSKPKLGELIAKLGRGKRPALPQIV
jgi:predicted N-acetyltransferase YhbS